MRLRRSGLTFIVLATSVAAARAAQTPASAIPGVVNYTRVDAVVACGGATSVEAFPTLKQEGFRAVVNLRRAEEPDAAIEASRAAAQAAGLKYIHIPFDSHAPAADAVESFLAAVKDPSNQPVYIHCGTANRVGAVWLIKRALVDGWDVERATAEAKRIGLRSAQLEQFALDYIAAHRN
jgi:uncharacterized protein (TIGR01244 family)